jgi:hypothetical protein
MHLNARVEKGALDESTPKKMKLLDNKKNEADGNIAGGNGGIYCSRVIRYLCTYLMPFGKEVPNTHRPHSSRHQALLRAGLVGSGSTD